MKFFLHGWVTSPRTDNNKKFFQEIVKTWWNKVLIFPFAQKDRDYDLQFEIDSQKFIDNNPDVDVECAIASDDVKILVKQIKEYKSLYFCGWYQDHHLEMLNQIDDLKELLKDKIVSWNSAWSMIWGKSFYSWDFCRNWDWLWYLNIKIMVHRWTDRYQWKYTEEDLERLKNYWENLPVYAIREQEYEMFEI